MSEPRILTEMFMDVDDFLDLEDCPCEGTCHCGQEDAVPDGTIN